MAASWVSSPSNKPNYNKKCLGNIKWYKKNWHCCLIIIFIFKYLAAFLYIFINHLYVIFFLFSFFFFHKSCFDYFHWLTYQIIKGQERVSDAQGQTDAGDIFPLLALRCLRPEYISLIRSEEVTSAASVLPPVREGVVTVAAVDAAALFFLQRCSSASWHDASSASTHPTAVSDPTL